MNIALLVSEQLVGAFRAVLRDGRAAISVFEDSEEFIQALSKGDFEYAAVSDELFSPLSWEEFLDRLFRYCPAPQVTVLLSNRSEGRAKEAYWKSCLARRMEVVHCSGDLRAAATAAMKKLEGDSAGTVDYEKGRVVMFVGSTPNIGTTHIAFGTAVRLAMETTCTVGYLCLNLKSSKIHRYIGRDDPAHTLDGLRAELRSRSLYRERLLRSCETLPAAPRLYVLPGNMIREQAEFFDADDIDHLLDVAVQAFDIVITDVNAYWDNAATVTTARRADRKIFVTSGDIAQFQEDTRRWLYAVASMIGLEPSGFDLVVNGFEASACSGIRGKDIAKETGMQLLAQIHRHSAIGAAVNEGRLLELYLSEGPMVHELAGLIEVLIALFKLPRPEPPLRKSWLLRLLPNVSLIERARG
jgi:Flp pilus assembly CpaE family ATPase